MFDDLGTDQPSLFGKAVISTDTRSLTAEDLEFFGPPVRVLSVAGGPLSPQSRLVWFEATAEGAIQLFTGCVRPGAPSRALRDLGRGA